MGVKLSAAHGERIIRLVAAQVFAAIHTRKRVAGCCRYVARFRPWPVLRK